MRAHHQGETSIQDKGLQDTKLQRSCSKMQYSECNTAAHARAFANMMLMRSASAMPRGACVHTTKVRDCTAALALAFADMR
jgi:hypothetical protein